MKKSVVLIMLLMLPVAFSFTFSQERGSVSLYPGDSVKLKLTLMSDHEETVTITPLSLAGWYTISDYRIFLNNSKQDVYFYISTPKTAKEANYLFRVKLDNSTYSEKLLWVIKVTKGEVNKLSLKGFYFPDKLMPGNTHEFRIDVENSGNTILYNIRVELEDNKGRLVKRQYVIEELKPGELYRIVDNITIKATARTDAFTVTVKGIWNGQEMFSKSTRTEIAKVEKLIKKKWGNILLIGYETVENITNLGNTPINYSFERNISSFQRLFLVTNGRVVDGKVVWKGMLDVGESIEIRYGWNILTFLIVTGLLAVAVIYLANRFAMPVVRKDVKGGKEIRVYISVKNRSLQEVKDVVVRDYVIPLFKPVPSEHGPKPRIKKTKERFVVSWRIPKLLPGEERILEYKLKPVFGVKGKLEFGKAELACKRDNMVIKTRSNRVEKEVM